MCEAVGGPGPSRALDTVLDTSLGAASSARGVAEFQAKGQQGLGAWISSESGCLSGRYLSPRHITKTLSGISCSNIALAIETFSPEQVSRCPGRQGRAVGLGANPASSGSTNWPRRLSRELSLRLWQQRRASSENSSSLGLGRGMVPWFCTVHAGCAALHSRGRAGIFK